MQNTTKLNGITGNLIWSIIVTLLILALIQPTKVKAQACATPTGLSHTALTTSSERVDWNANPTPTEYRLRYAEVGTANYVYFTFPGGATVNTFTINSLKANTTYYWQIRATCGGVNSRYSVPDTFTTMAGVISCVKVYGTYSNAVTFNTALVGWDSTLVADQFRVRYAPVNCPTNYSYETVSGGGPGNYTKNVSLVNLAPGTQYTYQVASICGGTQYSYSTANTFTTPIPGLSISTPGGQVCPGNAPAFTATLTQSAIYISYQWKVNGLNAGSNQNTFNPTNLNNGDIITCQILPVSGCVPQTTSNSNAIVATNVSVSFPFTSDFSSLGCWNIQHVAGTPAGDWEVVGSLSNPSLNPVSGTGVLQFRSSQYQLGAKSRLISPVMSFASITDPLLTLTLSKDNGMPGNPDYIEVLISTDNGGTWSAPLRSPMRYQASASTPLWSTFNLDLSPFAGNSEVRIAIQAVSEEGNNIGIDAITISNASCPTPKNRAVNNITGNTAEISWSNVGGTNYRIRYGILAPVPTYNWKNTGTNTSFTLSSLQPNTTYIWWVSSTCGSSSIGYQCYADTFTTGNGTAPCVKPNNLGHNLITGNTVELFWNPAIQADSFKVRYAEVGSSNYTNMRVPYGAGSFGLSGATLNNLFINTTYYWQVASICGLTETAYSAPDTFTTPSSPANYLFCIKPFNVSASNITANDAVVNWDTLIVADSFRVRYWPSADPGAYKYAIVAGGSPGSYVSNLIIDKMLPGTQYNYQVKTICSGVSSVYSDFGTFTTDVLRVANVEKEEVVVSELTIAPNPARSDAQIHFTSKTNGMEVLRVIDNTGRMVLNRTLSVNQGANTIQLESSNFETGVYTVMIIGSTGVQKLRFIVTQ